MGIVDRIDDAQIVSEILGEQVKVASLKGALYGHTIFYIVRIITGWW
jgi:hypothetical protein